MLLLFEMKFQFHKGTIKTPSVQNGSEYNVNFNSIKVRLKLCLRCSSLHCLTNFNSIKVRLKP